MSKGDRVKNVMLKLRPVLILAILIPVVAFMYYPMANMSPKDMHVGIVNLDTGAQFEQGQVNIGEKIVDKITDTSESSEDSPVIWETFESKEAAEKAMEKKSIYAFLVIPRDFSSKQTSTLDALNNLGNALGGVSEGVGKMSGGMEKMSGKLTKLPTAFKNLSKATSGLAQAADNLNGVSQSVQSEAGTITNAVGAVKTSQQESASSINDASKALAILKEDIANGADSNSIDEDLAAVEEYLNSAAASASKSPESLQAIAMNAGMINAQSGGISQGLAGISTANTNMSANFGEMAGKMSAIGPGVNKMQTALSTIGDGLESMSDNLDEKVTDAIDTINSDSDEDNNSDESVTLEFYIDQSNNAFIPTSLASIINGVASKTGMKIDTTYINEVPEGTSSMYFIMAFMMISMFCSMMPSIIAGITTRPRTYVTLNSRLKIIGWQILLAALIATTVGLAAPRLVAWMVESAPLDYSNLTPFIIIFSFGILILTLGVFDLLGMVGIAVPILTMVCGMAIGMLPYEFLPAFWQKYIYPWEPLRHLTDGLREINYNEGIWWNDSAHALIWMTIIGAILMLLSILKSIRPSKGVQDEEKLQEVT